MQFCMPLVLSLKPIDWQVDRISAILRSALLVPVGMLSLALMLSNAKGRSVAAETAARPSAAAPSEVEYCCPKAVRLVINLLFVGSVLTAASDHAGTPFKPVALFKPHVAALT